MDYLFLLCTLVLPSFGQKMVLPIFVLSYSLISFLFLVCHLWQPALPNCKPSPKVISFSLSLSMTKQICFFLLFWKAFLCLLENDDSYDKLFTCHWVYLLLFTFGMLYFLHCILAASSLLPFCIQFALVPMFVFA